MITFYKVSPNLWYFVQEGKVMLINKGGNVQESVYVDYLTFFRDICDMSEGVRPRVSKFEFESVEDFINFRKLLT